MAKFYAVRVGKTPGVYTSWGDCESNVKGYLGAVFKSFSTEKEAKAFVDGVDMVAQKKNDEGDIDFSSYTCPVVFVDGSYNPDTKEYAYGVAFVTNPKDSENSTVQINGKDANPDYISSMNIPGEILASEVAMSYAIEHGYNRIAMFHDYEGIAKWCKGEWKTKQDLTKGYKSFYEEAKSKLDIEFVHVKGHSDNYYNDLVDALAKSAIGVPLEKKEFADKLHPISYPMVLKSIEKECEVEDVEEEFESIDEYFS